MVYKKSIKKATGILLYFIGGVFILLCFFMLFINLPAGKRMVKNKVQNYLSVKLHTKVQIGNIDYSLPKWVELNNIYIEDKKKDTLVYGKKLSADINMLQLLYGNIEIKKIALQNIFLNVNRAANDSFFNYQFVVDAFAENKPNPAAVKDTTALKLTLDRLLFDDVRVTFKDKNTGNDFTAGIKNLDADFNTFQPARLNFKLKKFTASGVNFVMDTYKEVQKVTTVSPSVENLNQPAYGFYLTAGKFTLRDINIAVTNKISGLYYASQIKNFGLSNALLDLSKAVAKVDGLLLDSSVIVFTTPKQKKEKILHDSIVPEVGMQWNINAGQILLNNNTVKFDDNNVAKNNGFDFNHLDIKNLAANTGTFTYYQNKTAVLVKQLHFKDASGFTIDTAHVNFLMTDSIISARELYVKTPQSLLQNQIEVKFNALSSITASPASSLLSAVLKNCALAFNDLYLLLPSLKTSFAPAQFANTKIAFNTELNGTLAQVYIPYLQLIAFSGTSLSAHGSLYNLANAADFAYNLYIDKSNLLKPDLLKFVPLKNQSSLTQLPDRLNFAGQINGNKKKLVADINTTAKGMLIDGKFALKNIGTPAKLVYNFFIRNSSFEKKIITNLIPPGALPQEINLAEKIAITGTVSGNTKNILADLRLIDNYGFAAVKGLVTNIDKPVAANYNLLITTKKYAIGKLITQDSLLGEVTAAVTAKGTGFNYKTMRSAITASVQQLEFNKYNYKNAQLHAVFNGGIFNSVGSIADSSIMLQYDLKGNLQTEYPSVNGIVKIDTLQLKKLNLYKDTLNFSLTANIQANNLLPRNLDVTTLINSVKIQNAKNFYLLDSVSLRATSAGGTDDININAPFAHLHVNGAFDYNQIGDAITAYINDYYKITDLPAKNNIPNQQLTFEGNIKKHPLLTGIIPGLTAYDSINFNGSFTSANADSALNFTMLLPYIAYQNNSLRNGNINIASKNERINYAVTFDTLHYATNTFYGTALNGSAAKDSLLINVLTRDNKRKDWFGINASLYAKDNTYSFKIKDSLLLNYEQWNVAADNYINYSPAGIIVNNFLLTSDTSKIFIGSRQQIVNSPIDIAIDNFNLQSISAIISSDTLFASGIMDAKMEVNDLDKKIPAFTGNFNVTNLAVMQQPIGSVTAFATKQSTDNITATLLLTGNGNDIEAKGNYYLNNQQQQFDAAIAIKKFNLATLQGFTGGNLKNGSGNIHGNFTVNGKFTAPVWKGVLNFDTTTFTITQLGTPFKIRNQKITLDYPAITLNNFIINDSTGNQMKIDGNIVTNQGKGFDLNLAVNAKDFILVNAPKSINNQFYGFAAADAGISITGKSFSPDIEGDIYINDNSNVTIVIPEKKYGKDEGKTIVRFIDRDTFEINPPVVPFKEEKEIEPAFAKFLNYNLNIEIKKKAVVTIIIDPVTGDEIKVQGDARLNAGVDPGGNIILAGNYDLDNGHYLFNYQFLNRKFILEKGSTIIFGGQPMRAGINVTAAYTVNTAAKDLLGNETGTVDPLLANSFNQKVPFKVVLYLTGVLSKPVIKFDIQLAEKSQVINSELRTTIENKLTQIRGDESAINKQVFSLLLLSRFTGEQSSDFFKGNGTGFNDIARQSVSQFLGDALNEIAGNLLKGVDIDLNLNSYRDYSNGGNAQRSDLNVALSKTFLDDKLTVSVGKNFGIEGKDAASKGNNSFIPDVTVAYKLTKDGKYLIKAYRKNQFEVVLDGYVVETGLGFIVTLDYDKFNELIRRKK
jgi:translocation and assembly module TamB